MRQLHVLHVDDDAELRTIVQISLELDPQISVISMASVYEVLASIQNPASIIPDFFLLDNLIGKASGIDLLRDIRNIMRRRGMQDIPVAFLTGTLMKSEVEHLLAAGAVGVFTKPFDPLTLAKEIRALSGE